MLALTFERNFPTKTEFHHLFHLSLSKITVMIISEFSAKNKIRVFTIKIYVGFIFDHVKKAYEVCPQVLTVKLPADVL